MGALLLGFHPARGSAVAALSDCSNSPEPAEPADKPNFTGTAPSSSAAAASDTENEVEEDSADGSADDTETVADAGKGKDAEAGEENKIIPVEALDSLWVPALCENQAGNLEGGILPESLKAGYPHAMAGLKLNQDDTPKGATRISTAMAGTKPSLPTSVIRAVRDGRITCLSMTTT